MTGRRRALAGAGSLALVVGACAVTACRVAAPAASPEPLPASLVGSDGSPLDLRALFARARFTVLVFYSPDCHCLTAHEERLRELEANYRLRGVQFFWVDSESGASGARDAAVARARGYTFPILEDPGGASARYFAAEYATYSVIVGPTGDVRYRGGIDSDRNHLRPDARLYLRDALDDALAGRAVRVTEGPALGCALRRW